MRKRLHPKPVFGPDVVGIDASLTNTAAVLIPGDWEPGKPNHWTTLRSVEAGYGKGPKDSGDAAWQAQRIACIAGALESFFLTCPPGTRYFIEDFAWGAKVTSQVAVAQLVGVIKHARHMAGHTVEIVNQSTARKFFCGKGSGKGIALLVHEKLNAIGASFESSDIGDAFVCANYARTEFGLPGLTVT